MTKQVARFVRVATWLTVFATCLACRAAPVGEPPPCPAPSSAAVDGVEGLVERPRPESVALLTWIAEIERFCAALDAYRGED
jgi:hypothetical protein